MLWEKLKKEMYIFVSKISENIVDIVNNCKTIRGAAAQT